MIYLSVFVLIVSVTFIGRCIYIWLPREKHADVTQSINTALASGKYVGVLLLFVATIVGSILDRGIPRRSGWNLFLFSSALLLASLATADLKYKSLFGLTEPPWTSYEHAIQLAISSSERAPAGIPETPELQQARLTFRDALLHMHSEGFGVAYAVIVALAVVAANWFLLLMSLLLTRQVLGELMNATSWSARLGSILVLTVGSMVFAVACTLAVGILSNPVTWLVVLLAIAMKSMVVLFVGAFLALAFELWISGPWFRILLVASLLPCLCTIVLAGGDWIDHARRQLVAKLGKSAFGPFLSRGGRFGVPVIATALILGLIVFIIMSMP